MSRPVASPSRRSLMAALARRSGWQAPQRTVWVRCVRSLAQAVLVALLAAPLAIAWGVGHAEIDDYLGPHQVNFASNYSGAVQVDLGPLGNAYLPSPRAPIGLKITINGVGAVDGTETSFFSDQTLTAYAAVFAEPEEAVAGVVERLVSDIVAKSLESELVLLALFGLWVLRRRLLAPWLTRPFSMRRATAVYLTTTAVLFGSILAPPPPAEGIRLPVSVDLGTSLTDLTVDSPLLADLLNRGAKGVSVLIERQRKAVDDYITTAGDHVADLYLELPKPEAGETMLLGFSDLHCNQAMTELIKRMVLLTKPAQILDSGDDTVNGTAAERFCITREAAIADGIPFLVSPGNHDSGVTESQERSVKMTVLDGSVVDSEGLAVLGDDDPERNPPFSLERVMDRPETEEQLGQRMVNVAKSKRTDVILVHQPAASVVVMTTPDPPARLVLYGHYHIQSGPSVVMHTDGSWTVGMQEGTAGGVRQPTFSSFSTPFSPPLISADIYFYFRDNATGLITGVQPVHFLPSAEVVIEPRIRTGDLATLPAETRLRLTGDPGIQTPAPTPTATATR